MLRSSILSLAAAIGAGCLPPGFGGDGGPGGDADAGFTLPGKVLIYYGHGGVGPEGMWGDMTHADTIARYGEAGLQVDHTDQWPGSMADYRLAILPAPGFTDATARFSDGEAAALTELATRGGVVAIEAENSGAFDAGVVNALMASLSTSMYIDTGWVNGQANDIAEHALTAGVARIGFSAAAVLVPGNDPCLVADGTSCIVAARAVGLGWVALIADGNAFSDLAGWTAATCDNARLLDNLVQLERAPR